jgi:hypothetical protein
MVFSGIGTVNSILTCQVADAEMVKMKEYGTAQVMLVFIKNNKVV